MKRILLATVVAALALPASALAAGSRGVVLSVDARHHTIQVVDAGHAVHAYKYRGRLPMLHAGSKILYQRTGNVIRHVRATAKNTRKVAFLARVVRSSSKGLVVRLGDGNQLKFTSKQLHRRGSKGTKRAATRSDGITGGGVTINIVGLEPGVTVLITETVDAQGNITITITLPPPTVLGGQQTASGVVWEVDTDAFMIETGDGSDLRLHMAADALANLNLSDCDTVDVSYHQDAGMLVADNVAKTGTSNADWCSADQSDQDVVGSITAVSGDGITISTDQGSMSFLVDDSSITDGFVVGDVVDVTYYDNGDGTYSADDVEYVEQDATGTVTDVSDASVTITDDSTGSSETFNADPSFGMFDGVSVGDQVDVTYHQSGDQLVADSVDDQAWDFGSD
jgi:hypothetical protein